MAGSRRGQPKAAEKVSTFDCGGVNHNWGHGGINPHQCIRVIPENYHRTVYGFWGAL